jgi:hypothetical protein
MFRSVGETPGDHDTAIGTVQEPVISSAIGKIKTAVGSVTIARANTIVAQPAVGDLVYEGDLIETGIDGLVGIVFVDGTTFHLYASARMVLSEFNYGVEKSSNSALLQVTKGVFSFLAGKVATTGRLIIDTPLAKIRSTTPAAGIGSLAFSVFTVCLIREVEAASQQISWPDDDAKILPSDLVYGIFEVIDRFGRIWVVDKPDIELSFHLGSGNANTTRLVKRKWSNIRTSIKARTAPFRRDIFRTRIRLQLTQGQEAQPLLLARKFCWRT